ncbi:MAG: DUF2141 domain-containing protein [Rhodospirillales bacterium]|nr:DUF2141 domain-containing protein [Rhodospirillales bacterium]
MKAKTLRSVGRKTAFRAQLVAALSALFLSASLGPARPAPTQPEADAGCREPSPVQLLVRVNGVRSADGNVTVVLYGDNPADFLARGKRLDRRRVPARVGTVELCLAVQRPGTYAIALYHDEDGDHRFTRNLVGLPIEGYGFSRDAPTAFGLPRFEDVAFTVGTGRTTLEITMRY